MPYEIVVHISRNGSAHEPLLETAAQQQHGSEGDRSEDKIGNAECSRHAEPQQQTHQQRRNTEENHDKTGENEFGDDQHEADEIQMSSISIGAR